MARLMLSLLGVFTASLDGQPLTDFGYDKVRALLAFLAVEARHSHRRERLCGLFWPESEPASARQNLSQALHHLRRVLGDTEPAFLLTDRQEVRFNPDSDHWLDVAAFHTLVDVGNTTPTTAGLDGWEQAVALYKGPFLEGFSLPDAAPFEEWSLLQREWLQRTALETLRHLVAGWRDRADPERALGHAWRLIELEPWEEDAHRQIMQLLVQCERPGEALAQYERCRRILRRELDVDPRPETVELYTAIQQNQTKVGDDTRPAPEARSASLPPQATPLIGRKWELAQIARQLADPGCRLLTIVGPGGIGKTRLAVQAAQIQMGRFAQGVHFIDLAPVSTVDLLPNAILNSLHAPRHGVPNSSRQLLAFLADREMLLVLDNCEHLLAGVGLLAQMLHAAPALKLLVTSRERLKLHAEWQLPLDGLDVPPSADWVEDVQAHAGAATGEPGPAPALALESYGAVRLFLHCIRRLHPGFRPTPDEIAQIVHICHMLEGMPLAIELAAAWARTLPCAQIAQEITGSLAFLSTPLRDVPDRHRSMHATFDHSWRLRSRWEQSLLRQLAVFRDGFTREAAAAVTRASLADLASLVDASWLRVTPAGRYGMHELIRQYCTEKLERDHLPLDGECSDRVRDRHSTYFAAFLQTQEHGYNWQHQAMATITPELGNIMAAWNWAVASGQVARIDQMTISLFFIGDMEGWYHTLLDVFGSATRTLRAAFQTDPGQVAYSQAMSQLLATLLYCQGHVYFSLGLLERAMVCVDEALATLQTIPGSERGEEWQTWLRAMKADVLILQGRSADARRLFQELLFYLQQTKISFWPHVPEVGTHFIQAHIYANLGRAGWEGGDYDAAERNVRQALVMREQTGERRFRAENLRLLARILQTTGDYGQAETLAQESLRLSQAFGDRIGVAKACLALGRLHRAAGRCANGRGYCQQSLGVARHTGHHRLWMKSLIELGHIALALGSATEAKQLFEEAISVFSALQTAHSPDVVAAQLGLGWTALAMGDAPLAKYEFRQVLAAAGRTACETMEAIAGVARALHNEGQLARAAELLALVVESSVTAHATRELAAGLLRELETALTPDIFATAIALARQKRVEDVVLELA